MLIALISILVTSTITAIVITGLLLTGRVSAQTKVRVPLPRRARRVRTPQEQAQRDASLAAIATGIAVGFQTTTNTINAVQAAQYRANN